MSSVFKIYSPEDCDFYYDGDKQGHITGNSDKAFRFEVERKGTYRVRFVNSRYKSELRMNLVIGVDEEQVVVKYINGQPDETYDFNWTKPLLFHSGADLLIIKEFIEAISKGHLHTRTSCNTSLVSHKICFLAE